jgi:hypothetical protein
MAGVELPHAAYCFRQAWLSDESERGAHARIIKDLAQAKASELLSDFTVKEHAEAFPTEAAERSELQRPGAHDHAARGAYRAYEGARRLVRNAE